MQVNAGKFYLDDGLYDGLKVLDRPKHEGVDAHLALHES